MSKYLIGIDLGTTNSVFSYIDSHTADEPKILQIPQYSDVDTIENLDSLPSFIYLPLENEKFQLAWQNAPSQYVVGAHARKRSTQAPDRVIATSKSWLSHQGVDRRKGLLPNTDTEGIQKISPVKAAEIILKHMKEAWDYQHPNEKLETQTIVLTIPASFDAGARDLTREAALNAGYPNNLIVLEEPQAALYSWLSTQKDEWRKKLKLNDNLLVIDVGGGTTDFSLVEIIEENKTLSLNRKAVGKHLLVGGDNMDLALAHLASVKLEEQGQTIDAWQNTALWHSCRAAKEILLSSSEQETFKLTIAGRGKKLIGGSLSVELNKQEIRNFLLEGFFPLCELNSPIQKGRSGFQETGLPYEIEAAVTKHLAQFLKNNLLEANQKIDFVLFNGGVFKATYFQNRIIETLKKWFQTRPEMLDAKVNLDTAVAKGAAYYGYTRTTGGIRIKGGTARSYYLGFESSGLAIPGMPRPMHALCIVAKGMEEGQSANIPIKNLVLVSGETSSFPFFSSTERNEDKIGDILKPIKNYSLEESINITTFINSQQNEPGSMIPVQIQVNLLETGDLEIMALSTESNEKWQFEFNARDE